MTEGNLEKIDFSVLFEKIKNFFDVHAYDRITEIGDDKPNLFPINDTTI